MSFISVELTNKEGKKQNTNCISEQLNNSKFEAVQSIPLRIFQSSFIMLFLFFTHVILLKRFELKKLNKLFGKEYYCPDSSLQRKHV